MTHRERIDYVKHGIGLVMVVGLIAMAFAFGLGRVVKETSYGLDGIILALMLFAKEYCSWAFGGARQASNPKED